MAQENVATGTPIGEPLKKSARDLRPGDVIAPSHTKFHLPGEVVWSRRYGRQGREWVIAVYVDETNFHDSVTFSADAIVYLTKAVDRVGQPQPRYEGGAVWGQHDFAAGGPVLVGAVHVVHECCGKLDEEPHETWCAAYGPPGAALLLPLRQSVPSTLDRRSL